MQYVSIKYFSLEYQDLEMNRLIALLNTQLDISVLLSVCSVSGLFFSTLETMAVVTGLCFSLFRFKAVAAKSKLDLVNEGFTEFTIEDFHNTVSCHGID